MVNIKAYRPLCQSVEYFFKHIRFALDTSRQIHEKFLLVEDFNTEDTEPVLSEFLTKTNCNNFDCNNSIKDKT